MKTWLEQGYIDRQGQKQYSEAGWWGHSQSEQGAGVPHPIRATPLMSPPIPPSYLSRSGGRYEHFVVDEGMIRDVGHLPLPHRCRECLQSASRWGQAYFCIAAYTGSQMWA